MPSVYANLNNDCGDDPFKKLILKQVQCVIEKQPSSETLYELLKITNPSLEESVLDSEIQMKQAYSELRLRIHPDKHRGSKE